MDFPILSVIIFASVVGAIIVGLIPAKNERVIKLTALFFAMIPLVLSSYLFTLFDASTNNMQFVEKYNWIPQFDIQYYLGIDGISYPLVWLSALLTVICMLVSWNIPKRVKEFFIMLLICNVGMLGVFCALDFILFYVFWELVLIPMYFLIGIWGYENRIYAAVKFFIYTFTGSIFMLLGILALYFYSGQQTFDMVKLAEHGNEYAYTLQILAFIGFYLAFAIKLPAWPFHTWLPDAHTQAPTAGSILLAGILLKMGGYGFVRVSLPIMPDAFEKFIPIFAIIGVIGIVYGSYVALGQTHLKRLIAYSSVGHMGFVMLGLAAMTPAALSGVMLVMMAHGFITSMLFLLVGLIYERTHTYEISELRGLSATIPNLSGLFIFTCVASLGLPGLAGFWGEFYVLYGAVESTVIANNITLVIFALLGVMITTVYFVYLLQRIAFFKGVDKFSGSKDASLRELVAMAPLVVLIIGIGLYPAALFDLMNQSILNLLN